MNNCMGIEAKHTGRRFLLCALCACCLPGFSATVPAGESLNLEGAERFAELMEKTAYRPSASELETQYLKFDSSALGAFWVNPGTAGPQLAEAISQQRFAYRHAIDLCLPAIRKSAERVKVWAAEVNGLLSARSFAAGDVSVLVAFGEGRRGGTVSAGEVVVALEVLCRFARTADEAELAFEAAVRHEMVHVVQLRYQNALAEGGPDRQDSLLRQALMEGLADWVSAKGLGELQPQEVQRAIYGANHEAELWAAFEPVMGDLDLGTWMYGPGAPGQPADLGYWLGKQVVSAYINSHPPEGDALRTLLELVSPEQVLAASGYDPQGSPD